MTLESQRRRNDQIMLALTVIYIVVGALLIYWNFTGAISSVVFGIGIFILIAASLVLKLVLDRSRRRK
jgi:uncharacterized membrane protein HdeD (DUF308 family)